MTCSEKKGVERREGSREYVGCQEGHEGSTLTWGVGRDQRSHRETRLMPVMGSSKNGLRKTHGQRSGKISS